ncbi:hypothetical protein [Pseudonocardia acaciae]|uniref:hypothetical protein n=1 Tax=Pseudonocardia acaciae TaxID=551276 RepID=UPI000A9888BE|nr:hypothetical protein [Pseudonocardia acaciae]
MGELRRYKVRVNGHDTVLNLTEQDVELYPDATPVEPTRAAAGARSRTTANKARDTANK